MSVTPDSTFTNPEQLIADLRRQLLECQAERDEALEQQLARRRALHLHACQSTHWCRPPAPWGSSRGTGLVKTQQIYVSAIGTSVSGRGPRP